MFRKPTHNPFQRTTLNNFKIRYEFYFYTFSDMGMGLNIDAGVSGFNSLDKNRHGTLYFALKVTQTFDCYLIPHLYPFSSVRIYHRIPFLLIIVNWHTHNPFL